MLRRKPKTMRDRIRERGEGLVSGAASSARRIDRSVPPKVDRYAAGALVLGVANWVSMGLFNFDLIKALTGRRSVSGRTAYGVLSLSAAYAAARGARKAAS